MEQIKDDCPNHHVSEIEQIDEKLDEQIADDHHNHHVLKIEQIDEKLEKQIDQKLEKLSSIPSQCCIFKVHEALRNSNVKAYEPQVVAIGPYHHAKYEKNAHLRLMEKHKLWYLKQYLERKNATSAASYVAAMRELEGKARNCYAEPINLSTDEFVEMMLLDGCFIIELLLRMGMPFFAKLSDDPVDSVQHLFGCLIRDLLLFENQLPLFILERLYYLSEENSDSSRDTRIPRMVHTFFKREVNLYVERFDEGDYEMKDHIHLLSLVHCYSCYQFKLLKPVPHVYDQLWTTTSNMEPATELQKAGVKFKRVEAGVKVKKVDTERQGVGVKFKFKKVDTVLQEAGVKFKKVKAWFKLKMVDLRLLAAGDTLEKVDTEHQEDERSLFDIRFQNGSGIMEIPTLAVEDRTESLFRNFIAYEQYLPGNKIRYFTNYTHFIDLLVNSSKDVELFRGLGIFYSLMGDDEVVSSMLNKLGDGVLFCEYFNYCYGDVIDEVNKHCNRRMNIWLAKLRRDYFNSPWALISFGAALVLLLLTITQTVFSILSVV